MKNVETTITTEKINSTQVMTTKKQIENVIKIKGSFYAKSSNTGIYDGSITYNDISVYRNVYDKIMRVELNCCRCEDDHVIESEEFRFIDGVWNKYYECFNEAVPIKNIDDLWISVRNADEEFKEYTRHVLKVLSAE